MPRISRQELRSCIVEPAAAKVMYFEPPSLVDEIIDEVAQMPGALPLLSFTLSKLYLKYIQSFKEGKKNNRAITQFDYEELGGVTRSLTKAADFEYDKLVKLDPAYSQTITALPGVMRYKNPTPNPLPASDEGAIMYLITKESAVST
ncbi:hypothetical protein H6G81_30975 [Scytonema hofmannii FACHB-248]|uniref:Novel STAND NTPase 1 domain-containing protein n=2 Tax=Cyanophyceae TaxID=3028117 RepID=A0ABR8GZY0_9CYAN|nr:MULTISPECIES: hypothetical protein [Nostocales]MBD2608824.1 hypothetical protein [Scytonema hofmannii FACHB-248]